MDPTPPLAFVAYALGIGAVAICCAEGGSRMPTSGGIYGYVEAALGPLAGYIAGTLLWVGDVLAMASVAAAVADVAASLLPTTFVIVVRTIVIVGVIGAVAAENVGGVARGARLVTVATALKLLPLAVFVVAGAAAVHGANFSTPPGWKPGGLGRAVILAAFALTGMDAALCASGEVARPARTIPLALAIALASVTILYVAIQLIAQGVLASAHHTRFAHRDHRARDARRGQRARLSAAEVDRRREQPDLKLPPSPRYEPGIAQ